MTRNYTNAETDAGNNQQDRLQKKMAQVLKLSVNAKKVKDREAYLLSPEPVEFSIPKSSRTHDDSVDLGEGLSDLQKYSQPSKTEGMDDSQPTPMALNPSSALDEPLPDPGSVLHSLDFSKNGETKSTFGDTLPVGQSQGQEVAPVFTAHTDRDPSAGYYPSVGQESLGIETVTVEHQNSLNTFANTFDAEKLDAKDIDESTFEITSGGTMEDLTGYKDLSKPPSVGDDDRRESGAASGVALGQSPYASLGGSDAGRSAALPPVEALVDKNPELETEFTTNVQTLIRLVMDLPEGVTKQTGAQIIRLTMEAMGISMEDVLSEAQSAQSEMLDAVRANIKKIEEYKTVIRKLESDIKYYQGKANELSEIIDLFILSNTSSKTPGVDDLDD
ncbi:MAG: hypothetical protein KTR14_04680 [Vampirovibrio sp.]|nr:hypothetical protein [Vampirovibrio sp.]